MCADWLSAFAVFKKNTGKQSSGKGKQSKSWSKSEGEGESKENKGKSKGTKGAEGSHKGRTSNTGLSGLKTRNQRQARTLRNLHRRVPLTLPGTTVGIVTNGTTALDEWNDDWSSVGWHEDCEQTYDTSVSSFTWKF